MSKYLERGLSMRLGLVLFACMFFGAIGGARSASADVRISAGVAYHSGGYDLLSRYGEWMRVPPYGVVWCPFVDAGWEPFYDGRWIRTRGGWAWDSYEPFGEIVYHYGYWYREPEIGWFWVPGSVWSPARVQWYTHGDYCGWAPLPPPHYYWHDPWDSHGFNAWVVVNINDFCDDHIGHHRIDRPRYREVFHRDLVVKRAPDIRRVETAARRQIPLRTIRERPMDIRTDRIKIAERPATRRDARIRETAPEKRARASAPAHSFGVERKATVEKRNVPSQRRVVAMKQSTQRQREVAESTRTVRAERKPKASARNVQSGKLRTEERRSDRATDKEARR